MRRQKSIKPTRRPRIAKRGVSAGATAKARRERERAIVAKLMPLSKNSVRNTATKKDIYITSKGIYETAHHAAKSELSTAAAMDARRQLRDALPGCTTRTKGNRRQKEMRLEKMNLMHGRYIGAETKVNVGVTKSNTHLLYSITAKHRRRKRKTP